VGVPVGSTARHVTASSVARVIQMDRRSERTLPLESGGEHNDSWEGSPPWIRIWCAHVRGQRDRGKIGLER